MNGQALIELSALWPELTNGYRAWLDDAITVAQANKAKSPVYAVRVLANALSNNERPGQVPERKTGRQVGHTAADLDAIFGVDIMATPSEISTELRRISQPTRNTRPSCRHSR